MQDVVIVGIHRQDMVKHLKIGAGELTGTDVREINAALTGSLLGAGIGFLADVLSMRASRINQKTIQRAVLFNQVSEHALGGRRTTNIAHADK